MPCPECGVENAADHNYCKHCGTPLREVNLERELGSGFAERTRDRCLQLLKADPENPSAHYNLGLAYYHLGRSETRSVLSRRRSRSTTHIPAPTSSSPCVTTAAVQCPSAPARRAARSS